MGNQIATSVNSGTFTLSDRTYHIPDVLYIKTLRNNRFIKSVLGKLTLERRKSQGCIVKLFPLTDSNRTMAFQVLDAIEIQQSLIENLSNLVPNIRFYSTDKFISLLRPKIYQNLCDRLTVRPNLVLGEKLFIAFQCLKALETIHSINILHGDLKLENILITSWGWVMLSDISEHYKPFYLPIHDPSLEFSFFFDTSGKHCCNIAPERISYVLNVSEQNLSKQDELMNKRKQYDPSSITRLAADVFSMGCVLYELFSDGKILFRLPELLEYCSGKVSSSALREKISASTSFCPILTDLIMNMLSIDPSDRYTASECISFYNESVFPIYFYSLHIFMIDFVYFDSYKWQDWILSQHNEIELLVDQITDASAGTSSFYVNGQLLILNVILSCCRAVPSPHAKMLGLKIICHLSRHLPYECILERILPYLLTLSNDPCPWIRAKLPGILFECLSHVNHFEPHLLYHCNVFLELVVPTMKSLSSDPVINVRLSLVNHLMDLINLSYRFYELSKKYFVLSQKDASDSIHHTDLSIFASLDHNIQAFHRLFHDPLILSLNNLVLSLLVDSTIYVRYAVMKNVISPFNSFIKARMIEKALISTGDSTSGNALDFLMMTHENKFESADTNHFLLSHCIPVLNESQTSWIMRECFFQQLPQLTSDVDKNRTNENMLKVLCSQGFNDPEDWVVISALHCLTELIKLKLLQNTPWFYLKETVGLLSHWNPFIRRALVLLIAETVRSISHLQTSMNILPLIVPTYISFPSLHLEYTVPPSILCPPHLVSQPSMILSKLPLPFSRDILELASSFSTCPAFISDLRYEHSFSANIKNVDKSVLKNISVPDFDPHNKSWIDPLDHERCQLLMTLYKNGVKNNNQMKRLANLLPLMYKRKSRLNPLNSTNASLAINLNDSPSISNSSSGPVVSQESTDSSSRASVDLSKLGRMTDDLHSGNIVEVIDISSEHLAIQKGSSYEVEVDALTSYSGYRNASYCRFSQPSNDTKISTKTEYAHDCANLSKFSQDFSNFINSTYRVNKQNIIFLAKALISHRNILMAAKNRLDHQLNPLKQLTTLDNQTVSDHFDSMHSLRTNFTILEASDGNESTSSLGSLEDFGKTQQNSHSAPTISLKKRKKTLFKLKFHSDAINQVAVHEELGLLATASVDGLVCVWNLREFLSICTQHFSFEPTVRYNRLVGRVQCVSFIRNDLSWIACGSLESSSIHIFDAEVVNNTPSSIGAQSECPSVLYSLQIPPKFTDYVPGFVSGNTLYPKSRAKYPRKLAVYNLFSQPIVCAASTDCQVFGWDLRSKSHLAWKLSHHYPRGARCCWGEDSLDNMMRHVPSTALHVDPFSCFIALGTGTGVISLWDVRFTSFPVLKWQHPNALPVEKIHFMPNNSHSRIITTHSGGRPEMNYVAACLWDLSKLDTHIVNSKTSENCVAPSLLQTFMPYFSSNMAQFDVLGSSFSTDSNSGQESILYMAGNDGKIRSWDIYSPEFSSLIYCDDNSYSLNHRYSSSQAAGSCSQYSRSKAPSSGTARQSTQCLRFSYSVTTVLQPHKLRMGLGDVFKLGQTSLSMPVKSIKEQISVTREPIVKSFGSRSEKALNQIRDEFGSLDFMSDTQTELRKYGCHQSPVVTDMAVLSDYDQKELVLLGNTNGDLLVLK